MLLEMKLQQDTNEGIHHDDGTITSGGGKGAAATPTLEYDVIVYYYWMALHHDWQFVDMADKLGGSSFVNTHCAKSMGECGGGTSFVLKQTQPHWVSARAWAEARKKFSTCCDIVMIFHTDRHNQTYCESLEGKAACRRRFHRRNAPPHESDYFV
jgi:hypothetical protein